MDFRQILKRLNSNEINNIKKMINEMERNKNIKCIKNNLKNIRNSIPFKNELKDLNKIRLRKLSEEIEENPINQISTSLLFNNNEFNGVSGDEINNNDDLITLPTLVSRCSKIKLSKPLYDKSDLKDFEYINTSSYERNNTNTLLPLDFIQFHNDKIDIGILCLEVYNTNFEIINSCPLTIYDNDNNSIEVGDSLRDDDSSENDDYNDIDTRMSTVKDSNGNVYCIKKDIRLFEIKDYLNDENTIEPSNVSKYSHMNSSNINYSYINKLFKKKKIHKINNIPSQNQNSYNSFKCYIKGFFIMNYYSSLDDNDNQPDPNKYHTNMIWLEQLTLIKFISNNNKIERIIIGDFIEINYNNENDNYDLEIKEYTLDSLHYSCIPNKSSFFSNIQREVFKSGNYSILSIKNYWNNN